MNKKIHISDLCTELEEELYEELEITNMTDLHPSKSNIEKLVSEKIRKQGKTPKRRRFKALKVFSGRSRYLPFSPQRHLQRPAD